MHRNVTNKIRFILDECIPPVIRDSRMFMLPMFKIWFKNKNIKEIMNFKSRVAHMTDADFEDLYRKVDIRAADRPTDLNDASIKFMLDKLDPRATTMLDAGCGRGHWLNLVASKFPSMSLTGVDFYDNVPLNHGTYKRGNVESLPFPDKSFDIVTCHHTIEHLLDLGKAIAEMKRIARKQIIIATPCQRYYYYTLDLHVHFFPTEFSLSSLFKLKKYECHKLNGDWVYIGYLD